MEDVNTINLETDDITTTEKGAKKKGTEKGWLVFLLIGIAGVAGGVGCLLFGLLRPREAYSELVFPVFPLSNTSTNATYSDLTGEALADANLKTAPAFCMQVPNGTDGARPHSGLRQAGVIFEAIAEAGITRFAAIFQNPTQAIIGPIRSLRLYFLDWDVPFDCTIVHAGGSGEAMDALRAGRYKDLDESYYYMYRGKNYNRLWNNLFTTANLMKQFNSDYGYDGSNIKGFSRMTPEESDRVRIDNLAVARLDITKATDNDTSNLAAKSPRIHFRFGGQSSFNVVYDYDAVSNTYFRSYENGDRHDVYRCLDEGIGEVDPEGACEMSQMTPSVVIAMIVQQHRAEDDYHENITTIGSGDAYIFQNGMAIKGTWAKNSREDQIKFTDESGAEIRLAPGQTIISAIPQYGGVDY